MGVCVNRIGRVRSIGRRVRSGRVEDERGLWSGCFHRIETGTVETAGQKEAFALKRLADARADHRLVADEPQREVAIPRNLFPDILRLIAELRPPPVTSTA